MNKAMFLDALKLRLASLNDGDREDALSYYEEWIDDYTQDHTCSEEEAVQNLGPIDVLAASILDNTASPQVSASPASPATSPSVQAKESGGIHSLQADANDVRSIIIRTKNTKLSIKPSTDNQVTLRYSEDEYHAYDCVLDNGCLSLTLRPQVRFSFGFGRLFTPSYMLELSVPTDFAASVDAQTGNAALDMQGITLWGALRLQTSNANAKVGALDAKAIDIRTSNASLHADDLRSKGPITLRSSNGRLEARSVACQGPLHVQTSNGRVEAHKLTSRETLHIQSSNGSLHVDGLDANTITLTTSNASISGTLPGKPEEYSVQSSTSNAKNNLKNHAFAGTKQLEVRTSNSSIQVEFVE